MAIGETITSPKALPHNTLRRGGPHGFDVNSYLLRTYSKKRFFKEKPIDRPIIDCTIVKKKGIEK